MLTRCPNCETSFRVTPEQLKARQGQVRCGACQHVFNALESLVEEAAIIHAPAQEIAVGNEIAVSDELIAPSEVITSTEVSEPTPEDMGSSPAPVVDSGEPTSAEPETTPSPEPIFEPLLHELPKSSGAPSLRWLWLSGGSIALVALALQVLIHFRVELAVLVPISRPVLESVCSPFDCKVGLPSKVDLMTIESSDLQPDVEKKNILMLAATLRNRAPFAQAFPHLELSLTDTADKVIARRVLAPTDYLVASVAADTPDTPDTMIQKGLPTGEFSLKLPIEGSQIAASGYRLYLFYP